jgi:hypothetical protein
MAQRRKTREKRYVVLIRTRLDAETGAALHDAAGDVEIGSYVRNLIEIGLERGDALSPVRRKRAPIANAAELAAIVAHLGSLAGNAQRLYTLLREVHRIDDQELMAIKNDIRETSVAVRRAIGSFDNP